MLLFTSRWKNRGAMEKFAKAALPPHRLTRKEHCMGYFRTCPRCGAHLDPGELCDCAARLESTVFYGAEAKKGRNGKNEVKKESGKAVIY